jgi:signal transduction histidine kinase
MTQGDLNRHSGGPHSASQPDPDPTIADVVATIGHDLRTPLANVAAYIDLLRDGEAGELTEEQLHFLDVAGRNTDRVIELLDGFAERYRRPSP